MMREDGEEEWSITHNSRFKVIKSAISHYTRRIKPDPDSEDSRIPLPRLALILGNQMVQEVKCYKYLGIQIDLQLKWKEQAQRALSNAIKWILQFHRLSKPSIGVSTKLMRQLNLAVALPKITYGIDLWYTLPAKPVGCTRNTGSVSALHSLQKARRIASLAITRTLRTTPNNFIDVYAGIFPIKLALLQVCHYVIIQILTLPEYHLLHQIINKAKQDPLTKHLSLINLLLKQFNIKDTKMENIIQLQISNTQKTSSQQQSTQIGRISLIQKTMMMLTTNYSQTDQDKKTESAQLQYSTSKED